MKKERKERKEKAVPEIEMEKPEREWTDKELDAWAKRITKNVQKIINRQSRYMWDNNKTTDAVIEFLDVCPDMFAVIYDTMRRDMVKWALNENIKKNRALIDKIQAVEKDLNLEIHHEW